MLSPLRASQEWAVLHHGGSTHRALCFLQLLFHVNNGAGRITASYEPRAGGALCDGKWHVLQANKSKHRITLIVDGHAVGAESAHTQSTSADTNNPIYVGGYPGTCVCPSCFCHGRWAQSLGNSLSLC